MENIFVKLLFKYYMASLISVSVFCSESNIDSYSLILLMKKYKIDYVKVGKDYFVQDVGALTSVLNKHFLDTLSERQNKRTRALARAKVNRESSVIRQRLLEEGLTPDQIVDIIGNRATLKGILNPSSSTTSNTPPTDAGGDNA